jgi:hypothetical protein
LFEWGVSWERMDYGKGYAWCCEPRREFPIRDITEWVKRREFPPRYSEISKKMTGPTASWKVKLSCGHYNSPVLAPLDWKPEDGHKPGRAARIRARLDEDNASEEIRRNLERHLTLIEWGPQKQEDCPSCVYMRRIVGYRPVGPLARPKPGRKPKEAKPPSRTAMTRRVNAAEAKAARLRRELAEAEEEAERLRQARQSL